MTNNIDVETVSDLILAILFISWWKAKEENTFEKTHLRHQSPQNGPTGLYQALRPKKGIFDEMFRMFHLKYIYLYNILFTMLSSEDIRNRFFLKTKKKYWPIRSAWKFINKIVVEVLKIFKTCFLAILREIQNRSWWKKREILIACFDFSLYFRKVVVKISSVHTEFRNWFLQT